MKCLLLVWVTLLFALATEISDYAATPEKGTPGNPIRIMCIGDSVSAGYTDNPTWSVQFTFGYRTGLYNRLTAAGYSLQFVGESPEPWNGEYGLPQSVGTPDLRDLGQDHHRGYAWETARRVSASIDGWMATDKPDVICLMLGLMDLAAFTYEASVADITALTAKINTTWPDVHLIVAQPSSWSYYEAEVLQLANTIRDVIVPPYLAQGKRTTTVNQYKNCIVGSDVQNIDYTLYAAVSHLKPRGYDRLAQTWFEGIKAIYPRDPVKVMDGPKYSANHHVKVQFSGSPNSYYQFERADNASGPWEGGLPIAVSDSNGLFEIDDPSPAEGARFYRIVAP